MSYRVPPGGPSSIDLSTLQPYETHPNETPKTQTSQSAKQYAAHAAGVQAAHITMGFMASGLPAPQHLEWVEPTDRAGSPTRLNALHETDGSNHFFAQSVWPTREGELSPSHPHKLSPLGKRQQKGHFAPGQQLTGDLPEQLTPRESHRARAEVTDMEYRGNSSSSAPPARNSASGAIASKAHGIFFDGSQAKDLISGKSCLS